jgi:hypothetical protein
MRLKKSNANRSEFAFLTLAMTDTRTHTAFFAAQFSTALTGLLDAHDELHVKKVRRAVERRAAPRFCAVNAE